MENKVVRTIKLWGVVKDENDKPLPYTSVNLIKKTRKHKKTYYKVVANQLTDENGSYTFYVKNHEDIYKVVILDKFLGMGG